MMFNVHIVLLTIPLLLLYLKFYWLNMLIEIKNSDGLLTKF